MSLPLSNMDVSLCRAHTHSGVPTCSEEKSMQDATRTWTLGVSTESTPQLPNTPDAPFIHATIAFTSFNIDVDSFKTPQASCSVCISEVLVEPECGPELKCAEHCDERLDSVPDDTTSGAAVQCGCTTESTSRKNCLLVDGTSICDIGRCSIDVRDTPSNVNAEQLPIVWAADSSIHTEDCTLVLCETDNATEDNSLLSSLQRNPRNLILDSVAPDVTPHIVITRPDYEWDELAVVFENCVGPQWSGYLVVPQQIYGATDYCELPCYADQKSSSVCDVEATPNESSEKWRPLPVFNYSRFLHASVAAIQERIAMPDIVTALMIRQHKILAVAASQAALSFRPRYDTPELLLVLDKPFRWIDPGECLLEVHKHFRGTTIIDSVRPFVTPHIVISESPPQSPWLTWCSITNPQDSGGGLYLTVPPQYYFAPPSEIVVIGVDEWRLSGDVDNLCEDNSRPESPFAGTPDAECSGFDVEVEAPAILFESKNKGCALLERDSLCSSELPDDRKEYESASLSFLTDDDDEDGPPPFDEWYQSWASRC